MKGAVKRLFCLLLALALTGALPALAGGVYYMPDVTAAMSEADYWASLYEGAREVILTPEEIQAFNRDTAQREGTMVMDLCAAQETFDGVERNESVRAAAASDAEYYLGWTYGGDGEAADQDYFDPMIENCVDPEATREMTVRYAIAAERTLMRVFPAPDPILDDPADPDFDYQALNAVRVNEPLLLYTTSADGRYYLARTRDCSGWVPAEDVAVCADKQQWLSAWDLPSEKLLVVYGNKVYTDASNSAPETARRMLSQGTALELVTDLEPGQLVGNRSPYHNYVVWLPVRREDGSFEKQMALIPETAKVSVGYLPLTMANIAMVALSDLGDAYGWGGMLDVEDCSGMIRTVYSCFGLTIGRNSTWQERMNIEKLDMSYMSREEKCLVLDELPLGTALCFSGHEMMYLGKADGKYYVVSTVSSIVSPETGKGLRTRDVMINTLDVKRGSGKTWLGALSEAFMPCYGKLEGKSYDWPGTQWYHDGVAYCLESGALPGLDIDDTFGIGRDVGRDELVHALWVLDGAPVPEGEDETGAEAAWAAERDFLPDDTGAPVTCGQALDALRGLARSQGLSPAEISGGGLIPDGSIKREQLAMLLLGYGGLSETPPAPEGPPPA